MRNKPSPRIAIKPELYEAIRLRAAKEGMWPHELVSMWIREKLDTPPSRQIATSLRDQIVANPDGQMTTEPDSHMATEPKLPLDSEKIALRETATLEEKKPRPWHGGPPPYEEQHPAVAARVLELWAGGKRKGGLSRDAVARKLQAEGIEISAAQVDKITIRKRKNI
jgi:hypothetical protein